MLKHIWFKKLAETDSHADRLEHFYGGQAGACELRCCTSSILFVATSRRLHDDCQMF